MYLYKERQDVQAFVTQCKNQHKSIGFVPTMGALHDGHLTLIKRSLTENDVTIISIFVNPTQFNNQEDLKNYPRTFKEDQLLLEAISKDLVVFAPTSLELYRGDAKTKSYAFGDLAIQMEGRFRPGHFDGVGTVLHIFFDLLQPDRAYFGEKDFQQLQIVKKLVEIENLPVTIIGCTIFREKSGLAFSSRNERLTKLQHNKAKLIYETLLNVKNQFGTKSVTQLNKMVEAAFKDHKLFELEYFEIAAVDTLKTAKTIDPKVKYRAFIAVFADQVRLIDNIALN